MHAVRRSDSEGAALLVILVSAVLLMPLETASGTANAAQAADIADTAGAAGEDCPEL